MQGYSAFISMKQLLAELTADRNLSQPTMQQIRSYQTAVIMVRTIRKTLSNLEPLILAGKQAHEALVKLAAALPAMDRRRSAIEGAALDIKRQIKVWKTLRDFQTPEGKQRLYNMLKHRFVETNGVQLTYLVRHHNAEGLDPLHSGVDYVQDEFDAWLDSLEDRDPVECIVEFLFERDNKAIHYMRGRDMGKARRGAHRILAANGKLQAYYVTSRGERSRYVPSMDQYYENVTSIHRAPLETGGGGAVRGGDFIEGDPYVLSPDNKFYCINYRSTIHSEFLGGDCVQGAGLIVVKDGKVQAIDNRSGHYHPTWKNLHQTVVYLEALGVFNAEAIVGYLGPVCDTMFFHVDDFIRLGNLDFPYEETRAVLAQYHRIFGGNVPVPKSKQKYLPAKYLQNWNSGQNNRWEIWLRGVYGAVHSEPLAHPETPKATTRVGLQPPAKPAPRFGGML